MSSSSHNNNKRREMEGKEPKTGKCMHAHDESMRRMMSFVEPLGHSQIVDRQSLASLPVGFVKLSIVDDAKTLKVRLVEFMKSLATTATTTTSKKSAGGGSGGKSQGGSSSASQVSIKGYLAANNLVSESKAVTDQQAAVPGASGSASGSTTSAVVGGVGGSRTSTLIFDKREIITSIGKRSEECSSSIHLQEQVLQVCVFTYPTPYRMKTFLGTVHISIADMRCSSGSGGGSVNMTSYYKIFPTSSFVAGCPVIGVAPHCVNRCRFKNGSPLDKLCEEAKSSKQTTAKPPKSSSKPAAANKLRLNQLAHASSTLTSGGGGGGGGGSTSSYASPPPATAATTGRIAKSHSLRAIVSALTHRRRILSNSNKHHQQQQQQRKPKIESDVSLDNGYGSSSGDNCSRSSNVKLNDVAAQQRPVPAVIGSDRHPPQHRASFSVSPRAARLCTRRSEPSFVIPPHHHDPSQRLHAQTSIDSVRSYAGTSSSAEDAGAGGVGIGPCVCGAECVYDVNGLNYFSVSTGAIGSDTISGGGGGRNRRKTVAGATGATTRGKAIQGIVSSMKTLVYSVKMRARLTTSGGTRAGDRDGGGKTSVVKASASSRPTTAVPSSLRSFSLGPLTSQGGGGGGAGGEEEQDNVFEVLASLKKIRAEHERKSAAANSADKTNEAETTSTADTAKTTPPSGSSFEDSTTTKTSSDDGVSLSPRIDAPLRQASVKSTTWSCEDCIIAAAAAEKSTARTSSSLVRRRHRRTSATEDSSSSPHNRHSVNLSAASRQRLVRQKCFRSSDDVSTTSLSSAAAKMSAAKAIEGRVVTSNGGHATTAPRRKQFRLTKLRPVVDDDIAPYGTSPLPLTAAKIVKSPSNLADGKTSDQDEEEEDYHSCSGGDLYVDIMSLASSYQSLNCFVNSEDVYVR